MSKIYRIFVFGPIGSGKSKLCNFIIMKRIFVVGSEGCSLGIEIFNTKRNGLNLEIIDYTGYTEHEAEGNFKGVIDELKRKKLNSIDLFLLVIKPFYVRYPTDTKNYLKLILNIFTPIELFYHLDYLYTLL